MAYTSSIQWTDATWNPWHGCKKVSPGCKYCYMYRDKERYGQDGSIVLRSKSRFNDPLIWKEPRRIFTCSWSDFFIEEADAWRMEAWQIILLTPHHSYQILTKRPERIEQCLPLDPTISCNPVVVPDNCIFITSAENQETLDQRWPIMMELKRKHGLKIGLSLEPLLGPIDLHDYLIENWELQPDWVIVGGESGNDKGKYLYRPCEMEWIEEIMYQCREVGVPVFVKQMGTHIAKQMYYKDRHGGDINEWPPLMQVREMPFIRY